ncbi:hypothetical protein PCO86_22530 (plasmid) [Pectobacteriaceae bacterium CE70]|nr:hypothetical protein [Prodigiosinella sp. LS101]WJV60560.1 hypothetical protein PCO84_23035 [Pectobacteriaceae bacterium C111]WJV64905.1 hypothetical protein PCO87_22890 [Pectobacteriaceae bacterium C52]WJV69162.1 hypothetical protein PCO86_22530 [Pectobacteriaceae bacterium CE70]WJY13089.1 hypothetical protein PCO80_22345 [Pectobacteriaceae bacterium C80]WJY17385.1 hypothetical protein PCO82_22550 [Pectobacteriaceae bacterium CE90]
MSDDEFMKLSALVDELRELHEKSLSDPSLNTEQRLSIANEYTEKHKELESEGFRRVSPYRDRDDD